jgi:hypothetical protein
MSFSFLIQTGTKMANCDSPEVSTFLLQALAQLVLPAQDTVFKDLHRKQAEPGAWFSQD